MSLGLLAETLLTFGLLSTIVLGAVALLTRSSLARGPAVKDVLWKAGIVVALISTAFVVGGSRSGAGEAPRPQLILKQEVVRMELAPLTFAAGERVTLMSETALAGPCREVLMRGSRGERLSAQERAEEIRAKCEPKRVTLPAVLIGLWLVGLVGASLRAISARVRLHYALGLRAPLPNPAALEVLERLRSRASLRRKIHLVEARGLRSPAVLGWRTIGLPVGAWERLSSAELEGVLAHEVAHLERNDSFWVGALDLLTCLFWFQPLLRTASRGMRVAGELLCDDQAVAWTGRPGDLARSLLRVGEWVLGVTTPVPELAVVRTAESGLAQRVGRILDGGGRGAARNGRLMLLLVVALGIGCSALPRVHLPPSLEVHIEIIRSGTPPAQS